MAEMNDAPILDQVREHWQNLAAMIVWKVGAGNAVVLTADDIAKFAAEQAAGHAVLLTHGHKDSIEFRIVTKRQAERLAAHQATMKGSA